MPIEVRTTLPPQQASAAAVARHADLLKRIYSGSGRMDGDGNYVHRVPSTVTPDEMQALSADGLPPNALLRMPHDEVVTQLRERAAQMNLQLAVNAFVAALDSAGLWWQPLLPSVVLGLTMPAHAPPLVAPNMTRCHDCFHADRSAVDLTYDAFLRHTSGGAWGNYGPLDALLVLAQSEHDTWPQPTPRDVWVLHRVFDLLRSLPGTARYSQARKALKDAKLLRLSTPGRCESLLESLAWIGILETPDYPGLMTRYTSAAERDQRPNTRVEVPAPLAWWSAADGINEELLTRLFGHLECPEREPPLVTAKAPVRRKAPAAGPRSIPGPLAAGDVYVVRYREDAWGAAYCHEVRIESNGTERGRMELLDYFDATPPLAEQAGMLKFSTRRDGRRTQSWCAGLLKTTGIKRIAIGVPRPACDLPEPGRLNVGSATHLAREARWHFDEL